MRSRTALLLAIASTGCFSKPDRPVDCVDEPFDGPFTLDDVNRLPIENEPTLIDGGLELWMTVRMAGGAQQDLYMTRRPSLGGMFATPAPADFDDSSSDDADPAFTADGLDLMFVSTRGGGGAAVWETTRPAIGATFDPVRELPELAAVSATNGIDLSSDGLTLYYATSEASQPLYQVARRDRTSPFDVANARVVAMGVQAPSISPDQLELFFDPPLTEMVFRRTRANREAMFDDVQTLVAAGADTPDLTADSRTLMLSLSGSRIAYMTRTCR